MLVYEVIYNKIFSNVKLNMSDLQRLGLDKISQQSLVESLKDINPNIIGIFFQLNNFFVLYNDNNLYHIDDKKNERVRKAIQSLLKIQKLEIEPPGKYDDFFNAYLALSYRYFIIKIKKMEEFINNNKRNYVEKWWSTN